MEFMACIRNISSDWDASLSRSLVISMVSSFKIGVRSSPDFKNPTFRSKSSILDRKNSPAMLGVLYSNLILSLRFLYLEWGILVSITIESNLLTILLSMDSSSLVMVPAWIFVSLFLSFSLGKSS